MTPGPHITAALLSVGDELALGQTLDTNSRWLAERLFDLGFRTTEHATVDDDPERIAGAMTRLAAANDLVICTGGLGPTADDLTRHALARALAGAPAGPTPDLVADEDALEAVRAWFDRRPGGMPEQNAVQAMRPPGATCLANPHGTAPGLYARDDASACDLFCLPGPPREMRPMFEREIAARLAGHAGTVTRARYLLTIGLGESAVAEQLGTLMDRGREDAGEVLVGTTASRGVVTCRLRATAADNNTAAGMLDEVEAQIRERLPAVIFDRRDPDPSAGSDHDLSDALPRAVLEVLRARHEKIAVVESCTGGGLGAELTSVPGSSDVFFGGWITYENAAKVEMVGVPPDAFSAVGAVSRECAQAMAAGGLDRAREMDRAVAHAIAITGIAGPAGGGDDKPAGTVWIARASADGTGEARRFLFRGGRAAVREWSSRAALAILRLHLIGESMTLLAETHD